MLKNKYMKLKEIFVKTIKNKLSLETIVIISILLLASSYRIHDLDKRSVWYDEVLTVAQSEKSFIQINKDVPTPVHYYFVKLFMYFGKNTFVLGLPSVIFGVATVYLVYVIAKQLFGRCTAVTSSFLAAVSPMLIEFSRQILFFSYYTFFSTLSIYFLVRICISLQKKEYIRYKDVVFLVLFCIINILTMLVAMSLSLLLVLALITFALLSPQALIKNAIRAKWVLIFCLALAIIGTVIFINIGMGGLILFLKTIKLDLNKPIEIGWSLSHQLHTPRLIFNKEFFRAMFSWFSLGPTTLVNTYITLAILGIIGLILNKERRKFLVLFITIVGGPFLLLYLFRLNHWFEEKYLIYIIPPYLILVGYGFVNVLSKFVKLSLIKYIIIVLFLFFINKSAYPIISTTTTYGFPSEGYLEYDWGKAYRKAKSMMKPGDRIFIPRGETQFLQFYMGSENKNKTYFEDPYLTTISNEEEYEKLMNTPVSNYYITIAGFEYMYARDAAKYTDKGSAGNFQISKFKFVKRSPEFKVTNGVSYYFENFRTSKYMAESLGWNNLVSSYAGIPEVFTTEYYNVLSPYDPGNDAYIEYSFPSPVNNSFPSNFDWKLELEYHISPGCFMNVYTGESKETAYVTYSDLQGSPEYKNVIVPLGNAPKYMKIHFSNSKPENRVKGCSQLLYFVLSNVKELGVTKDKFEKHTGEEAGTYQYKYNARMEALKSERWIFDTIAHRGWVQNNDGYMIKLYGDPEKTPLVYKFSDPNGIKNYKIVTRISSYYSNPVSAYVSSDNRNWKLLFDYADRKTILKDSIVIDGNNNGGSELYIKYLVKEPGLMSRIQNLQLYIN